MNKDYFISLNLNDLKKESLKDNLKLLTDSNEKGKESSKVVLLRKENALISYETDLILKEYSFIPCFKSFGFQKLKTNLMRLHNKRNNLKDKLLNKKLSKGKYEISISSIKQEINILLSDHKQRIKYFQSFDLENNISPCLEIDNINICEWEQSHSERLKSEIDYFNDIIGSV